MDILVNKLNNYKKQLNSSNANTVGKQVLNDMKPLQVFDLNGINSVIKKFKENSKVGHYTQHNVNALIVLLISHFNITGQGIIGKHGMNVPTFKDDSASFKKAN